MIVISMSCWEDAISKSFSLSSVSDILFHFCNVLRGLIGTKVLIWVSYLWMNCWLIAPQTELGQYDFSQVHAWMITTLCPTDFLQLATDSVTLLVEKPYLLNQKKKAICNTFLQCFLSLTWRRQVRLNQISIIEEAAGVRC